MSKLKIITVVGTRPELIRLSRIIAELNECFNHVLVHTGQNYDFELNKIFFNDLDIKIPDYYLDCFDENDSPAVKIGKMISAIDPILESEKPDAFLILGDTNSALTSIAAKKRKIPIFHYEAGNRCFDQRVPEENNRKITDHLADINLTYSSISKNYLIQEGFPIDRIIKIGSPMMEVLNFYSSKFLNNSIILNKLNVEKNGYFLISCHREENIDDNEQFDKFCDLLVHLSKKYDKKIIVSTHPRTQKKIDNSKKVFSDSIVFSKPFSFTDYITLQINSALVLSDSGTINEEASILKFNAINIRSTHERPEAVEECPTIMSSFDLSIIDQAINLFKINNFNEHFPSNVVSDYNIEVVSKKISRIILSYISFVNSYVWRKKS